MPVVSSISWPIFLFFVYERKRVCPFFFFFFVGNKRKVLHPLTLTAMIYAIVANVVIPARISEKKEALEISSGCIKMLGNCSDSGRDIEHIRRNEELTCPDPLSLKMRPKVEDETL